MFNLPEKVLLTLSAFKKHSECHVLWLLFEKCFILEIYTMPFFWPCHVAVASANSTNLCSLGVSKSLLTINKW